ncbi:hypothetical protein QBC42DRAFT_88899 [Cladorrhinum samala]|uniref:Uncharacterized protein n=1 Tax=Cladorrhinum samala TaxID=585594 RepID=A0AAV9HQI3_9PEZI|nr:hypothetical protein QBC42DRAFT_88899 [Cladorrhinum samala]
MGATSASLLAWAPWLDLIILVTIVLCATASAIVVSVSDDKEVDSWRIKPAVWLAIFSAMSNIAFSSALATGIAVRFWLQASNGTSLSQLHYIWDHGRGLGFLPAVKAGSEARRVTLISVLAYILQFSGSPLLQRSTATTTQDRVLSVPMFFDMANRIPDGWFGSWTQRPNTGARGVLQHRRSITITSQWFRNESIPVPEKDGFHCPFGTCRGLVRGAGLAYNCTTSTSDLDLSSDNTGAEPTVFLVKAKMSPNAPSLILTTSHISSLRDNCQATMSTTVCSISAAVVEYPITIQNSTASLRLADLGTMPIISRNDNTSMQAFSTGDAPNAPVSSGVGPMGGLMDFVEDYLQENATATFTESVQRWLYAGAGPGPLGDVFFRAEPWDYSGNHSLSTCGLVWEDPTQYVLTSMHEYMFRVAHRVGEGLERSAFTAERVATVLVFKSDNRFLGTAMGAAFAALLLVSSLSWGWWRLKRPVGLSPLETGKLFGGRLYDGMGTGATIDKILSNVKDVHVQMPVDEHEPVDDGKGAGSTVQVFEVGPRPGETFGSGITRVDTEDRIYYGPRIVDLSARTTAQGSVNSQEGLRI